MKSLQGRKFFSVFVTLLAFAILTVGCSNDSASSLTGPADDYSGSTNQIAKPGRGKAKGKGKGKAVGNEAEEFSFPLVASKTFTYNAGQGYYNGGKITFGSENRSKFEIEDGALTPPPGTTWGEPVTITMVIDYDTTTNQLLFTFDPHGCQFSPRAVLKMDYRALDVDIPQLYYIDDNGNYIPQEPDQIETNKRWLTIKLDHFSRYALIHS